MESGCNEQLEVEAMYLRKVLSALIEKEGTKHALKFEAKFERDGANFEPSTYAVTGSREHQELRLQLV